MKISLRLLVATVVAAMAVPFVSAGTPAVAVTVSDASNHVAYKGRTNSGGSFATSKLAPGEYTVQFNSMGMGSGSYALVISSGKQKVMAEAVPGTKFAKGGVAMRVKVGKDLNITGMVSTGKVAGNSGAAGNAKVKIINGKRYVWVGPETGSNMGGHWEEEGRASASNVHNIGTSGVQDMQDRGMQGGIPGN